MSIAGRISESQSLFTYTDVPYSAYHNDETWTPSFFDDTVSNASMQVLNACKGDQQCIYDYAATGNAAIGIGTMETNEDFDTAVTESSGLRI